MSDRNVLMSMGFDEENINKALKATKNAGLQPALDWLCEQEVEDTLEEVPKDADENQNIATELAKSLKCDECGEFLRSTDAANFHASKTGHTGFSESVEELPVLTEEERRNRMEKIQELLKVKKVEREERDKKDALLRERERRKHGREIIDAKTKFEEDEMKRIVDQTRREKEEDRLYRERLKEQIARDREARKTGAQQQPKEPPLVQAAAPVVASNPATSCRIQIRHQTGAPITATFQPSDTLFAVALQFAQKTGVDEYSVQFRTAAPPATHGTADMSRTLLDLGFCPSIVLNAVVKPISDQ